MICKSCLVKYSARAASWTNKATWITTTLILSLRKELKGYVNLQQWLKCLKKTFHSCLWVLPVLQSPSLSLFTMKTVCRESWMLQTRETIDEVFPQLQNCSAFWQFHSGVSPCGQWSVFVEKVAGHWDIPLNNCLAIYLTSTSCVLKMMKVH